MKRGLMILLAGVMSLGLFGCTPNAQPKTEPAADEVKVATEQQTAMDFNGMDTKSDPSDDAMDGFNDMEPNDDGFDDDYQNEQAGVEDGDGNVGREGEIDIGDENNSIQLGKGKWPEDAPPEIPEPVFGEAEITGIVTSSTGTVITYKGVGRSEAADLVASYLENDHWNLMSHSNDSDWESYSGQNGDLVITIEWDYGDFSILWESFG